ncbi:MAG TPA: universal stress protein [Terriglobia bacterium]|nr:universal stress protein [Terriglobia bacterium]
MTYKAILAAVSGGTASAGAVEIACRLAQRFNAHLEGFHVRIDPVQIIASSIDGVGMPLPTEWIDEMTADAAATAAKSKDLFKAALARHDLAAKERAAKAPPAATWREEIGSASDLLARRARFFDLTVLGRSERVAGSSYTDAIEQVLIQSGRPVLLAPAAAPKVIGQTIAMGWNGSTEAVRALGATLPLLSAARTVTVVTVDARAEQDVTSVMEYLAWHGITASHRGVSPVSGVGAGEQLLATARDIEADLLVMGGYGRAPWREVVFGGATRQILQSSILPIVMAH